METTATTLRSVLSIMRIAVPARSPVPAMLGVEISPSGFRGTNGAVEIWTPLPGVPVESTALISHARLWQAVSSCDDTDPVGLSPQDGSWRLASRSGSRPATWTLPVMDAAGFPPLEVATHKPVATLQAKQFQQAMRTVLPAAERLQGGVLLSMKDGVLTFVSTDGTRLATYEIDTGLAVDDSVTLVPPEGANALRALVSRVGMPDSDVDLTVDSARLWLTAENGYAVPRTMCAVRLSAATFPGWQRIIKAFDEAPSAVIAAGDLLAATRAAAVCCGPESKAVKYEFTRDTVRLSAASSAAGASQVAVRLTEPGITGTMSLDPTYVEEFLETLETTAGVDIEWRGGLNPVRFRCEEAATMLALIEA